MNTDKTLKTFLPWTFMIVAVWALCPFLVDWLFTSGRLIDDGTWGSRGQFGDTFGAVNALFTGLAFAGTIYAIGQQRRASIEQQAEISRQQQTQAEMAEAMKRQAEIMKAELQFMRTQQAATEERLRLSSLPAFIIVPTNSGEAKEAAYDIENAGAPVRNISISAQTLVETHFTPHDRLFWKTDQRKRVLFFTEFQIPSELRIKIECETLRGEKLSELYLAKWRYPAERVLSFEL